MNETRKDILDFLKTQGFLNEKKHCRKTTRYQKQG